MENLFQQHGKVIRVSIPTPSAEKTALYKSKIGCVSFFFLSYGLYVVAVTFYFVAYDIYCQACKQSSMKCLRGTYCIQHFEVGEIQVEW